MASSSIDGNVGTDGASGPLSGLFTIAIDSQIPSHDTSNNNDDNDNGRSNIIDRNLTNAQAAVNTGNSDTKSHLRRDQIRMLHHDGR